MCESINLGTIKNSLKCIVNYVNKIENVCGRPYCFRLDYSNTLYFSCKLPVFNKKLDTKIFRNQKYCYSIFHSHYCYYSLIVLNISICSILIDSGSLLLHDKYQDGQLSEETCVFSNGFVLTLL